MSEGVIKTIITLDEDQFSGRYSNAAKVDIIKIGGIDEKEKFKNFYIIYCGFYNSIYRIQE